MIHDWLVVFTPLKNWQSVGITIPRIWKNKTYAKPPTRWIYGYMIVVSSTLMGFYIRGFSTKETTQMMHDDDQSSIRNLLRTPTTAIHSSSKGFLLSQEPESNFHGWDDPFTGNHGLFYSPCLRLSMAFLDFCSNKWTRQQLFHVKSVAYDLFMMVSYRFVGWERSLRTFGWKMSITAKLGYGIIKRL